MPHFSIGATNYNIKNPDLQLPRIRHEFPRSSPFFSQRSTNGTCTLKAKITWN